MLDLQFHNLTSATPEWQNLYKISQEDRSHKLWENYQTIDMAGYETMILTMCGDLPASFQGIYNNGRWPKNVSRFCNRAYINPHFRQSGHGLEITWRNVKYTLDNYHDWKKDVLFISRGVQYDNVHVSWKKFEKFCDFLVKNTGYDLIWDNFLYKCCANECKECYQFCVWYDPLNIRQTLDIPKVSQKQWEQLS
jgi:hypothetical protein